MNTEPKTREEIKAAITKATAELAALNTKLAALDSESHPDAEDAEEIQRRRKFKSLKPDAKPPQRITRMDYGGGR